MDPRKLSDDLMIKAKEDLLEKQECREIIKEILNFNVSQRQVLELINLLSLELENREWMAAIRKAVKEVRGNSVIIAKSE